VRETTTVQARRRPKHSRVRETTTVQARRRPKHSRVRETTTVQARRRPKHSRVRETTTVQAHSRKRYVRAPSLSSIGRSAIDMGFELGAAGLGFVLSDAIDRFLATYDPAAPTKAGPNKFTSDGTGMLGNSLNTASPPNLYQYGALAALTLVPLGGSLFMKHPLLRSTTEGLGIGSGIKLVSKLWTSLLMPLLIGKDTSVPALQKNWIARLYPAEVSAVLNMKSGTAAVSSGGAASKAGTLSGGSDQAGVGAGSDAGPFALAGRFDRGRGERREWVTPGTWAPPAVPAYVDPSVAVDVPVPVAVQPAWPAHFGERHRWSLRGVGDAVQDMASTVAAQTGVHPAHAINAAMHVAAEPHCRTCGASSCRSAPATCTRTWPGCTPTPATRASTPSG
jgi:hypothetical protein